MDNRLAKRPSPDLFSIASWSYLPSNLRHLRPPVPNDLQSHHDASIFAFEDALEDLLAVSQGDPLPDIDTRCGQRRLLRQIYPNGEPTWLWLRRLESQGLLGRRGALEMHVFDDLGLLGRQIESELSRLSWPDWEAFHDQLQRNAADVWRRDDATDVSMDQPRHGYELNEPTAPFQRSEDGGDKNDSSTRHPTHQISLPDHFDDLFSVITSTFAEGQKTWDTFVKTIVGGRPADQHREEDVKTILDGRSADDQHHKEDRDEYPKNKQVVTRDEHVDQFGYLHTIVTRKTYDENGDEIASQSHFTMRPVGKKSEEKSPHKETDATVIDRNGPDANDEWKPDEKKGWFWK